MNISSTTIPLNEINSFSININPEVTNNNEEEIEKIKKLIEEQKKNSHKYPLLACFFLMFYYEEKSTLTRNKIYSLMENEILKNKNKIISSPTNRYCIIDLKNYKYKIKDILKKKKWFTKNINEIGETEYTLNPNIISSITPKIISYIKVINKNENLFQDKEVDVEEVEDINSKKIKPGKKNKNNLNKSADDIKILEKKKKNNCCKNQENLKKNKKRNKIIIDTRKNYTKDDDDEFDIICQEDEQYEDLSLRENIQFNQDKNIDNNTKDQNIEKNIKSHNTKNISNKNNNICFYSNKIDMKNEIEEKTLEESIFVDVETPQDNSKNEDNFTLANNKVGAIINIGEIFMKLINNNEIPKLISKNIDSTKEIIKKKEQEIQSDKLFLEELFKTEEKLKSPQSLDIQDNITKIKDNLKEFKDSIELLTIYQKIVEKYGDKEDVKEIIKAHKEKFSKCSKTLELLMSNLSLAYSNYINFGVLLNLLMDGEKIKNYLNVNSITEIEDLRNLFKKIMDSIKISDNLTKDNETSKLNENLMEKEKVIQSEGQNLDNNLSSNASNVCNNNQIISSKDNIINDNDMKKK